MPVNRLFALLCLFLGSTGAFAQAISRVPVINTLAGDGTAGYSGDGGSAASAELNNPYGIVTDNGGNLYIADAANNRIRKVAVGSGIISTLAGNGTAGYTGDGGPAIDAELQSPVGVALDAAGDLYIADQGNGVIRKVSASGTITTVAGNNEVGYSGDGGMATSATLYAPAGVAIDSGGNLYIADEGNNRIRVVNPAGTITTFAGSGTAGYSGDNGPATAATLNKPSAVVEDSAGNLYILDTGNDVVRKVTTAGTITTVVGTGTAGYTGDNGPATSATLNTPSGLKIDSAGNLYIADSKNNVVRMVTTAGVIITIAGTGTYGYSGDGARPTSAMLSNPQATAVDTAGNLYISDQANNRIREVNAPVGSFVFPTTPVASAAAPLSMMLQVNAPGTTITGITVPPSQGSKQEYTVTAISCALKTVLDAGTLCNVSVAFSPAYPGQRPVPLQVASSAGTFNFGMTGIGTAPQVALSPGIITTIPSTVPSNVSLTSGLNIYNSLGSSLSGGLVIDNGGNLYAAVDVEEPFELYEAVGQFAAGTGTFTNLLGPVQSAGAFGLALDSAGNLYAAGLSSDCVYKLVPGATDPTDIAGICGGFEYPTGGFSGDNGLAVAAQLNGPASVAVDPAGNVYIADSKNNRIRKVIAGSAIITTIAGNGTAGFGGDNGPAVSAELNNPMAVVLDSAGNLYIADSNNHLVRKISASTGVISTVAGNGTAGASGDDGPATSAELNTPDGLAIDAAGDIYVADSTQNTVRMVSTAGIITTVAGNGTQATNASTNGDGGPATSAQLTANGLALDPAGNLYIAGNAVRTVNAAPGILTFPAIPQGFASEQNVSLTNTGNTPLSLANPTITAGFTLDSGSTCPQSTAGTSLAPGASCTFGIDYVAAASSVSGTATVMDNALNSASAQMVQLNGAAGDVVTTTTSINVTTPFYGQTQISASILATAGTVVPPGSVVFSVDGTVQPAVTVSNAGVATLPAAVSNALAVGSHTIGAAYTSSIPGFSNSVATRIFPVGPPPSITIASSASSVSVAPGGSVTANLTITPVSGYVGALQFSCSNLPQSATCSFQPATVELGATSGPQTTVVTIQTAGSTAEVRRPEAQNIQTAAAFWAPGLLLIALTGRRRRVALLVLLAGLFVVTGCGGGGSTTASTTPSAPTSPSAPSTPSAPATPAGTSTVQITASAAGNAVQSFALTLTVQ